MLDFKARNGNMGSKMFYIFDSQTGEILSEIYSSAEQRDIKLIEIEIKRLIIEIAKKYCL